MSLKYKLHSWLIFISYYNEMLFKEKNTNGKNRLECLAVDTLLYRTCFNEDQSINEEIAL